MLTVHHQNLGFSSQLQLHTYMHTVLPLPKVDLVSLMDSRPVPQKRFVFFNLFSCNKRQDRVKNISPLFTAFYLPFLAWLQDCQLPNSISSYPHPQVLFILHAFGSSSPSVSQISPVHLLYFCQLILSSKRALMCLAHRFSH